jgi:hypothetical protein
MAEPLHPPAGPAEPAMLVRRARRRARTDALLLALATLAAGAVPADPARGLKAAALLLSAGLLIFLWRRGRDLDAVARARAGAQRALDGRGLSLSDWHTGRPLPRRADAG